MSLPMPDDGNGRISLSEQRTKASTGSPAIRCENLWKIYSDDRAVPKMVVSNRLDRAQALKYGGLVAVRDVSFDVRQGEIFCIMGLSGSGKSTLLRHVNRLIEPTAGKVFIDGRDIVAFSANQLRQLRAKTIGMVFQNVALLPHKSARYNVGYGLKVQGVPKNERNRIADEMLELVQLSGWGDRYPRELSGGMQQRVGLARALASDPNILLLDEPFSALDPLIRAQIRSEFGKLSRAMGKTAIFITHDFDEAMQIGDRIAIMKDGEFVQVGPPEEIMLTPVNSYVEQFVKYGSTLRLVRAKSVMTALARPASELDLSGLLGLAPKVSEDANIDALAVAMLSTNGPLAVVDRAGEIVGTLTKEDILRVIAGQSERRSDMPLKQRR